MHYERSRPRLSPKEYKDFRVEISGLAQGFLGNISEEGLLLIVSSETQLPEVSEALAGRIQSTRLSGPLDWSGTVAWKSESAVGGDVQQVAGISFDKAITLPDDLLALSMSTFD